MAPYWLKGFTFCVVSTLSVLLPAPILILPLTFLVLPISYKAYRFCGEFMQYTWFAFMAWNTENIIGTQLCVTGDNIAPEHRGERVLIISNHRTRLDFMFVLPYFLQEGRLWNFKAVVKRQLKFMLPFGWPMQLAGFVFLARDWEEDQAYVQQVVEHLADKKYPTYMLLFPEGTDKTENTLARSNEYAAKNGLPLTQYTLHPRTTGFNYIVEKMRESNSIDAVYDLTMAFRDHIPQSEKCFFTSDDKIGMPNAVHFHMKRYPVSSLPMDTQGLGQWLARVFTEKEARLARFYEKTSKFEQEDGEPKEHVPAASPAEVNRSQLLGVLIWFGLIVGCVYLMVSSSLFFWYTVVGWFALQGFTYAYGIEKLEIYLNVKSKPKSN